MPRPLRIVEPGVYHLTARGNRRQPIYLDERDYRRFLATLAVVCAALRWKVHAFCLMPNHYHLLVEIPDTSLSPGMYRLNGLYAQWFNRRHDVDGHLFQGRFKAVRVESHWHLARLARYIPLNPVRAGLCARPEDWPWSSYRAAVGLAPVPRFLRVERTLELFGSEPESARKAFAEFVRAGSGTRAPPPL